MIITVGSIKGGVGKSMIAVNLAVIRAKQEKKVLLCFYLLNPNRDFLSH